MQQFPFFQLQISDDADMEFEFILTPTNKAELAFLLSERCQAMQQNAFTTRMWRHPIRKQELQLELDAANAASGSQGLTVSL